MHNHRRLQSWGLSEFTARQKSPKNNQYNQNNQNNQNSQKSPIVASSNASLEAVLPEYRKLKSAYRKKYAAHLQPKPQTQKTETTVVDHNEEGKRRAREWSHRAMGGNRAMDAYTVGVPSSSSFSPPPPPPSAVDPRTQTRVLPVPQRYLSQPPSSTTPTTTPTTTLVHESPTHKRRQRQRRVSILSTQEKKKILLKTREIEKEKSKQNLKALKQQKQAELLAASQPTKDLTYLEGYENIAKEEYDTMIHDLDNRLDTHVKVIRQRRASYNVVKANVPTMTGTSNEEE